MIPALLLTNGLLLSIVTLIHVYWIMGGRRGLDAALPYREGVAVFRPGRLATLAVTIGFAGMAVFFFVKAGWFFTLGVSFPVWINHYGLWILAGVFSFRAIGDFRYVGFFKRVREGTFARLDTRFYSPLCLLLAVNSALANV